MKVCLGQINTTPGDFDGNLARVKHGIDQAASSHCDVILFPELCIPGYLSQDLIYNPLFIDRNLSVLQEIVSYTAEISGLHVVVGYIERNEGVGKPYFNSAAVIKKGCVQATYRKILLPFYDVFDEARYYEPGDELTIVEIDGRKVGITICEDLWNDKGSDGYNYERNPMSLYLKAGADTILSLNSSPYVQGKCWQRLTTIAPGSIPEVSIVYVNQVGGQDELVFDGQSFVLSNGDLLHLNTTFAGDSFDIVDLDAAAVQLPRVFESGMKVPVLERSVALYDMLVLGLRDYVQKSGFSQLVLASSGGVDSAVVCKLACDAVGAKNVHAIRMPSIYSSDHSRTDAITLHRNLGCWDYEVDIAHEKIVSMLNSRFAHHDDPENLVRQKLADNAYSHVADENMQARLRDLYVMHFSNAYGAMPLSTGNKTESACGYYTHFDMNFSYAPIKDLYKFQVFDIARQHADIPSAVWQKPPSAELAHDQEDEKSLLPYVILDPIVAAYVEDYVSTFAGFEAWLKSRSDEASLPGASRISGDIDQVLSWQAEPGAEAAFTRIVSLIGRMEYKRRQTCPGTKVSRVAFGIGRRVPIVEKWL